MDLRKTNIDFEIESIQESHERGFCYICEDGKIAEIKDDEGSSHDR